MMERLDKRLCAQGLGTRSQAREMIRAGRVAVNGQICLDPGRKIGLGSDQVALDGQALSQAAFCYGMLNKPPGVLSAARDPKAKTVMDLLPPRYRAMGLMPVGRLDKDARGLLLLTTDGPLAHFLLSPRRHVDKVYRVMVDGPLDEGDAAAFAAGLVLSDFTAKPAKLQILSSGEMASQALVTLSEGKFHQVKRMFLARGRQVTDLERVAFGSLRLEGSLPEGAFRELTPGQVQALRRDAKAEEAGHG